MNPLSLVTIQQFEEIYKIPVHIRPQAEDTAVACGIFSRRIIVNAKFMYLPTNEQLAILLHEAGHHYLGHHFRNLLLIPVFWTDYATRKLIDQELEADDFVVLEGHGVGLMQYLRGQADLLRARGLPDAPQEHPPIKTRVENIREQLAVKERLYAVETLA